VFGVVVVHAIEMADQSTHIDGQLIAGYGAAHRIGNGGQLTPGVSRREALPNLHLECQVASEAFGCTPLLGGVAAQGFTWRRLPAN
jgi:hypothetical protein